MLTVFTARGVRSRVNRNRPSSIQQDAAWREQVANCVRRSKRSLAFTCRRRWQRINSNSNLNFSSSLQTPTPSSLAIQSTSSVGYRASNHPEEHQPNALPCAVTVEDRSWMLEWRYPSAASERLASGADSRTNALVGPLLRLACRLSDTAVSKSKVSRAHLSC